MLFLPVLLLTVWQTPGSPSPCQARLDLQQRGSMLAITGLCRNLLPTAGRYRYELSTQLVGSGGRSQNTQSGEFDVAPQQEVSLSRTSFNASPQDTYRINLRVLDLHGKVVAQDSTSQHPTR